MITFSEFLNEGKKSNDEVMVIDFHGEHDLVTNPIINKKTIEHFAGAGFVWKNKQWSFNTTERYLTYMDRKEYIKNREEYIKRDERFIKREKTEPVPDKDEIEFLQDRISETRDNIKKARKMKGHSYSALKNKKFSYVDYTDDDYDAWS